LLVLAQLVDLALELLYLGQVVAFADSLPLELLVPHLKVLDGFLEPLALLLLLVHLGGELLDFLEHLVEAVLHPGLTLVPLGEFLLRVVVSEFELLDFEHLLLYFRSVLAAVLVPV